MMWQPPEIQPFSPASPLWHGGLSCADAMTALRGWDGVLSGFGSCSSVGVKPNEDWTEAILARDRQIQPCRGPCEKLLSDGFRDSTREEAPTGLALGWQLDRRCLFLDHVQNAIPLLVGPARVRSKCIPPRQRRRWEHVPSVSPPRNAGELDGQGVQLLDYSTILVRWSATVSSTVMISIRRGRSVLGLLFHRGVEPLRRELPSAVGKTVNATSTAVVERAASRLSRMGR